MKPVGIPINKDSCPSDSIEKIQRQILRIMSIYGLDDSEWSKAVSSQYFLLCLAKQLKWGETDYHNLLNKCLSNFSVTFPGGYILDSDRLLITPDETKRIYECMQEEDQVEKLYSHSAKMQAKNIRIQQMHLNFHYGLLVRIVSLEDTEIMRALKHTCLDELISKNALDTMGGWYPFRVPWITARVLISLRYVDLESYLHQNKLTNIIHDAILSLFKHIDGVTPYWRSGVGKWVSIWESTGLCLEAIYTWKGCLNHEKEIKRVIDYVCSDESLGKWMVEPTFESTDNSNDVLSAVVLSSVVYRIAREHYPALFQKIQDRIIQYYNAVLSLITSLVSRIIETRQYCTVPQILHYIYAITESEN